MLIVAPSDFSAAPAAGPTALFDWATSSNGQQITGHGQCAAALLPRDDDVVLVLPPRSVSWHRVSLPKVAQARLRAALDGLLEDRLLADTTDLHFALEPGGRSGQTVWVAACDRVWLRGWLQVLESASRPVGRIAPALWPLVPAEAPGATPGASRSFGLDVPSNVHWAYNENGQVWLGSAGLLGVSCAPVRETPMGSGTAADMVVTALMPPANDAPGAPGEFDVWLADPSVAQQAEQVLQQRFELVTQAAWLLRCAQSDWNLAQFDLSLSAGARRSQRLKRSFRQWRNAPAWRPARWGFAALVGVQLVGLNAAAWHERSTLNDKQQAIVQTLQKSFPQVTVVLDAPVQMQREVARLQAASGALSAGDLETLLAAIDQAAAGDALTPSVIAYSTSEGRFSGWRASEEQLRALQQTLEQSGWRARFDGNELALRPPEL